MSPRPINDLAQGVDLMNDPVQLPKAQDEADTCRICRGEGTEQEPLFYPCKCSGSIKFVHQECLMEWLSHSQKKHCELCKTSFRFTKLYHPSMPSVLPWSIFLKQAALHTASTFMMWCRATLVASVWLFWLPWITRFIWWCMFWVADGGWSFQLDSASPRFNATSSLPSAQASQSSNGTDSLMERLKSSSLANIADAITPPIPLLKSLINGLVSMSFSDAPILEIPTHELQSASGSIPLVPVGKHDTLLSRLPFFYNLTSHRWLNKFITDILEGQIITFAVVVAAILIFLIREWVVQQQPVINLAAGQGALMEEVQAAHEGQHAIVENEEEDEEDDDDDDDDENHDDTHDSALHDDLPADEHDAGNSQSQHEQNPDMRITHPELMSDENVDQLVHEVEEYHDDLVLFSSRQDWRDDIDGETSDRLTRAANLVERVQNTCIAFQQASRNALLISDLEELRKLVEGLARFQPALTHFSASWSTSISECVHALQECVDTLTSVVGGPEDGSQRQDSSRRTADNERPMMPDRAESSRATEIGRILEEMNHGIAQPMTVAERYAQRSASGLPNLNGNTGYGTSDREWNVREAAPSSAMDQPEEVASDWEDTFIPEGSNAEHSNDANEVIEPTQGTGDAADLAESVEDDNVPVEETIEAGHRRGLVDKVLDWMWADVGHPGRDTEIEIDAEDGDNIGAAPEADLLMHVAHEDQHDLDDEEEAGDEDHDPEVAAAAAEAGLNVNDPDGADEVEDLEGVLELIGMQGPILGLMQNAIFSCVLVAATVGCAVWVPYLWGKVVLMFLAHPIHFAVKVPIALINGVSNFFVDMCLFLVGIFTMWSDFFLGVVSAPLTQYFPSLAKIRPRLGFIDRVVEMSDSAFIRMMDALLINTDASGPAYLYLSLSSHAALHQIRHNLKATTSFVLSYIQLLGQKISGSSSRALLKTLAGGTLKLVTSIAPQASDMLMRALRQTPKLAKATLYDISSTRLEYAIPPDVDLGRWTANERLIAVLAGYVFFTMAGILYLRRGTPITSSKYERTIMDILQQSGGIFKVIFIISIEMLLFPLYCGVLLDVATLPLFENAALHSRLMWTIASPWTSIFVHWFVGTCYMFHFALFVSMCRKMMRKGVLYFIRDPDDPTFHPVRDVLERNVQSQLRKIAFSALVYGALVIVCMGSVVWALAYVLSDLFPIRWTSDSALGFSVDLLVYTALVPLIAFLFRPSVGFHHIYEWWLRKSASFLRLSHFLFGDEATAEQSSTWTGSGEFQGRYVRAPGSDQVRILRNQRVFLEVDAGNQRLDGQADSDDGLHGRNTFTKVYIPPSFRLRIGLFCGCLWMLSAVTGLIASMFPLLIGRSVFLLLEDETKERMNDLYAYAVGISISASLAYVASSLKPFVSSLSKKIHESGSTFSQSSLYLHLANSLFERSMRVVRFGYVYGTALVALPTIFALVMQLYILLPLSTYIALRHVPSTEQQESTSAETRSSMHYFQIIQTWSLGLMYVRIMIRIIMLRPHSRPAFTLRKIIEHGWLNPSASIATRAFFLPTAVVSLIAISAPIPVGYGAGKVLSPSSITCEDDVCILAMRFAYPAVLIVALTLWALYSLIGATRRWRLRIRDEVYLIGERLHNYGEKRPPAHAKRFGDGGVEVDESGVSSPAG